MRTPLNKIMMAAIIAALLPIMPCDAANPSALVWHWIHSASRYQYQVDMELFKDGKRVLNSKYTLWKVENNRFIVDDVAYNYEVSDSTLALIGDFNWL